MDGVADHAQRWIVIAGEVELGLRDLKLLSRVGEDNGAIDVCAAVSSTVRRPGSAFRSV